MKTLEQGDDGAPLDEARKLEAAFIYLLPLFAGTKDGKGVIAWSGGDQLVYHALWALDFSFDGAYIDGTLKE